MNDDLDQFEQRVRRQPVKAIPAEWRAQILAATQPACPAPRASWLAMLNQQLNALLWPHPKAWAGLAAIWVVLGVLNFSTGVRPVVSFAKTPSPSPDVLAAWPQQSKLYTELLGRTEAHEADRPPVTSPKPRTGRVSIAAV